MGEIDRRGKIRKIELKRRNRKDGDEMEIRGEREKRKGSKRIWEKNKRIGKKDWWAKRFLLESNYWDWRGFWINEKKRWKRKNGGKFFRERNYFGVAWNCWKQ